jgi:AraC-like DNA-binding protein
MARKSSLETAKLWRIPQFNAELLHAKYVTQSFPRHSHDQYAIGVIESGALGFYYRGENVIAPQGNINLCIPGEVHTGHAATDNGWVYRMFYFDPELLRHIASEVGNQPHDVPFFKTGVIQDDELAQLIRQLHLKLEQKDSAVIEQESHLLWTLAQMILRHADDPPTLQDIKKEPLAVKQIKEFIETHYAENFSIDELAQITHLSPFHLIRVFGDATGIPPHAYLRQIRVKRAKEMLTRSYSISNVAQATGFNDQSHLNRWFKRLLGITPGQYRNSVQYS